MKNQGKFNLNPSNDSDDLAVPRASFMSTDNKKPRASILSSYSFGNDDENKTERLKNNLWNIKAALKKRRKYNKSKSNISGSDMTSSQVDSSDLDNSRHRTTT